MKLEIPKFQSQDSEGQLAGGNSDNNSLRKASLRQHFGALSEQLGNSPDQAFDAFCTKPTNTYSLQSDSETPCVVQEKYQGGLIETQSPTLPYSRPQEFHESSSVADSMAKQIIKHLAETQLHKVRQNGPGNAGTQPQSYEQKTQQSTQPRAPKRHQTEGLASIVAFKGLQGSSNSLLQRRKKIGLEKLSCKSFTSYSEKSSEVSICSTREELSQKMLEENRARCDFFRHFSYNEDQIIGSGCSSTVYACTRAQDQSLVINGESLVVKVCYTKDEPSILKAAQNEAQILQCIDNPHINKFVAFYEDPLVNKTYLVLERAGDKSIMDFVNERKQASGHYEPPDAQTVKSIMKQLFTAVGYIHGQLICHRDLKPDNLLVSVDKQKDLELTVKLIDFNVAVKVQSKDQLIKGGTGMREWSAPETYQSFYSDFKIDCWTLGCVMYFICTGDQLFQGGSGLDQSLNIDLEERLKSFSNRTQFQEMVDLLRKLIEIDPAKRLSCQDAAQHPWLQGLAEADEELKRGSSTTLDSLNEKMSKLKVFDL